LIVSLILQYILTYNILIFNKLFILIGRLYLLSTQLQMYKQTFIQNNN